MGMLANAARPHGRGKDMRSGIIEQQERARRLGVAVIGEQGADGKAVANPMAAMGVKDLSNLFHDLIFQNFPAHLSWDGTIPLQVRS